MAYSIFSQLDGPRIDTNLFPSAYSAGIAGGNAMKTPIQAGIEGMIAGVQTGQQIAENFQNLELKQNEIDQLPVTNAMRQEQLEGAQLVNELNTLKIQREKNLETLTLKAEKKKLQVENAEIDLKLKDTQTEQRITDILSGNDLTLQRGMLNDPAITGWMLRNPSKGMQVAGRLTGVITAEQSEVLAKSLNYAAERQMQSREREADAEALRQVAKDVNKAYENVITDGPLAGIFGDNPSPSKILSYSVEQSENTPTDYIIKDSSGQVLKNSNGLDRILSERSAENFNKFKLAYNANRKLLGAELGVDTPQPQAQTQAAPGPAPVPAPAPVTTSTTLGPNERITNAVQKKFEVARQSAVSSNQGPLYSKMVTQGQSLVPTPTPDANVEVPQNKPTPPNQPAITQPIDAAKEAELNKMFEGTINLKKMAPVEGKKTSAAQPKKHDINWLQERASLLVGAPVKLNFVSTVPHEDVINRVNSIPELQDYNPLIKGMVAVESAGNPFAISKKGAKGLLQLMPKTAAELGLAPNESFDPEKNIAAGAKYLQDRITRVQKRLAAASDETGFPISFDLRFALAAYNGGDRHILNGIAAGHYTWDSMKEYLKAVKGPKAAKENIEYPEKVIAATIAFMKGGNQADDGIMYSLMSHGLIEI